MSEAIRARAVISSRAHFCLLVLALSTAAMNYARFTLGPLQESLKADLSLSDNVVALLQGPAIAMPSAIAAIPIGLVVDRYSRSRLLTLFAALNLGACILTALAPSLLWLFVARALAGLSLAGILVTAYSIVSDLYAPTHRGRATGIVAIGEVSGAPAAFALGGVLLAMSNSGNDWRGALLWLCVPLLLTTLPLLWIRDPPRSGLVEQNPRLHQVWPALWRLRALIGPLLLARIMMWVADGAVLVWGAPTFSRVFGLPPERIGAMMAVVLLISGVLGPLLGGILADVCQRSGGPRRTMAVMGVLALISAPGALFALMPNVSLAGVALAFFLTVGWTIGTVAIALGTIVIPGELRGVFVAIQITLGALFAVGVAPVAVSVLSGALGGSAMIGHALGVVCGGTSLLAAVVFSTGRRSFSNAVES